MTPPPESRERFIFPLIFLVMALLFALTSLFVKSYRSKQSGLARDWATRGDSAAQSGSFPNAVQDYETALIYSHDDSSYELKLAQALLGDKRYSEAGAYLEVLWERQPGSGLVNLELARLAVRDENYPSAVSFFHNAIYGAWETDPEQNRRAARFELSQMLLDRGQKSEAQGELIALAANLPDDANWHARVGSLLLSADGYARALQEFQMALAINHELEPALAGAGEAAYELQDYSKARDYLQAAVEKDPQDAKAAEMLENASLVVELDPTTARLSSLEKANRILRGFQVAWDRLDNCIAGHAQDTSGPGALEQLRSDAEQIQPKVQVRTLRSDSDLELQTMDLIDRIEETTVDVCGLPTGNNLALLLIARRRESNNR